MKQWAAHKIITSFHNGLHRKLLQVFSQSKYSIAVKCASTVGVFMGRLGAG